MAVAKGATFAQISVTIAPNECADTNVQGCRRRVRVRPVCI